MLEGELEKLGEYFCEVGLDDDCLILGEFVGDTAIDAAEIIEGIFRNGRTKRLRLESFDIKKRLDKGLFASLLNLEIEHVDLVECTVNHGDCQLDKVIGSLGTNAAKSLWTNCEAQIDQGKFAAIVGSLKGKGIREFVLTEGSLVETYFALDDDFVGFLSEAIAVTNLEKLSFIDINDQGTSSVEFTKDLMAEEGRQKEFLEEVAGAEGVSRAFHFHHHPGLREIFAANKFENDLRDGKDLSRGFRDLSLGEGGAAAGAAPAAASARSLGDRSSSRGRDGSGGGYRGGYSSSGAL